MEIQEKKQSGASGYFYLFLVAMLFSFGGTCVKLMKPVMSPEYITFSRFAVGIFFLLCLKLIQRKKTADQDLEPLGHPWWYLKSAGIFL